ncbi:iron-sulfur cluster assembly scaffold protein [Mycoplasmoides pirum]|uniref:iron-sulfur cluster assembly scaffold protein n=1 Tax=Mycoplasmoides pirum TaxID=2122 RepID=UPI000564BE5B|nr:iron-sulfur cluster assembly scaffold protein [Mycoplasmoides pirum]
MSAWYNDDNYRRTFLVDRYSNPQYLINESEFNKLKSKYAMLQAVSRSCSDNFDIYLYIKDEIIQDAKFIGEGCVISLTSTDILLECLINKTIKEASNLLVNYLELVCNGKQPKNDFPELLFLFNQIYKQSNRIICASNVAERINIYLKGL